MNSPSVVEPVGDLNEKIWTLAINEQGEAYGVAYEGGNLYRIDLANNAATTLVGPTGKEVWYTQSMAFNYDTGELFWAQFATANDHGFYQVDTETGAATYLGEIGENGVQLTGLFMMPTVPEIVDEIYVEGFTVPTWGEHPDYDLEVDPEAPYTLSDVSWHCINGDHSLFDLGQVFGKDYLAYTIDFYVSDPAGVEEQSSERPAAPLVFMP